MFRKIGWQSSSAEEAVQLCLKVERKLNRRRNQEKIMKANQEEEEEGIGQ